MRIPFLRSKPAAKDDSPVPAAEPGSVQMARIHARRRLAGALVLLVAGIAVFPLLFETKPRPIPVDTPIVMPARDAPPVARGAVASAPAAVLPADAGIEGPADAPAPAASEPAAARPVQAQAQTETAAAPQAVAVAPSAAKPAAASEPKAGTLRFVVQAGAYSEAGALRDARLKVEKLGLKTYTQVIESDTGKRTRVRVGPFATRQEAEAVAAKVKAAGVQASILTL
jgi:DedD protein